MSTAAAATATATAVATAAPREEIGRWRSFPRMTTQRSGFGAAADGDRLLYAVGGSSQAAIATAEVWDATANRWSALPKMTVRRFGCAAAVIDGKLFAVGGRDGHGSVHDSVSMYDPNTKSWTVLPRMHARRWGCAAAAFGGKLFVFGGQNGAGKLASAEVYDPTDRSWMNLPDMSQARLGCAAAAVGGQIFVGGGECIYGGYISSMEMFDPRIKAWSSSHTHMSCGRRGCAAAGWEGEDRLYIFGGYNWSGRLRSAEMFDVGEGTWSSLANMESPRRGCAGAVVNGRIIAMGGEEGPYATLRSCESYLCANYHRIDRDVATYLPKHLKDQLLHIMMVACRLDDERARRGEGEVGTDLWWRIVGMLRGDLS